MSSGTGRVIYPVQHLIGERNNRRDVQHNAVSDDNSM